MSGTLFKQVELLAEQMLEAAEADDEPRFYQHYEALEALCMSHQGKKSDHPVLWETLADFSEDNPRAIALYQQAFSLADQLKENEYKASIMFALAQRQSEEGDSEAALLSLEKAQRFASFTEDEELQQEIAELQSALA
ncbi:tetratricopeptide repeat protein [Neptuniibacter halophilus]|uniref:tetratricopeptide repeat protein n=1 Tax=Neptuniibacter halophilus TaxID=651666 RepID=UPI002573F149|nr:tetratricopeptide repeat protein [Neptuniibacter halophilus]